MGLSNPPTIGSYDNAASQLSPDTVLHNAVMSAVKQAPPQPQAPVAQQQPAQTSPQPAQQTPQQAPTPAPANTNAAPQPQQDPWAAFPDAPQQQTQQDHPIQAWLRQKASEMDKANNQPVDTEGNTDPSMIPAALGSNMRGFADLMDNKPLTLDALSLLSMFVPIGEMAEGVKGPAAEALGEAATAIKEAPGKAKALVSQPENTIENTLKPLAHKSYEAAKLGPDLPPDVPNSFLNQISSMGQKKSIGAGQNEITQYIQDATKTLKDKSLPVSDLIDYDQQLGDLITKNYKTDPALSRQYHQIQDMLRSSADGAEGAKDWADALKNWQQGRKLDDISRIATRAESSPNPSTAIQAAVRTMRSNPAKTRGWSDDELAALKDAGKTGMVTHLAQIAGNQLGPLATGATATMLGTPSEGLLAAMAHGTMTKGAKNFAGNMQMKKLNSLADLVKNNAPQVEAGPIIYPNNGSGILNKVPQIGGDYNGPE